MTYALLISIPMLFVWLVVLFDIEVRRDLSGRGRAAWIASVTLLWPSMILYLLLRPVQGRVVTSTAVRREAADTRQQLVEAVLDRRAGRSTAQEHDRIIAELRGGPPSGE